MWREEAASVIRGGEPERRGTRCLTFVSVVIREPGARWLTTAPSSLRSIISAGRLVEERDGAKLP